MRRRELKTILTDIPRQPKRTLRLLNGELTDSLWGSPGHRDYSERDVRLIEAWNRITYLTGAVSNDNGTSLRRRAARLLAAAPAGYVWISEGRVGWSLGPPVHTMKQGATCWPVATGLD